MKLYNDKRNIAGDVIMNARNGKRLSREAVSASLALIGINITAQELYRMESNRMIIKDFELIAIAKILEIDLNALKNLIED